MNRKKTLVLLLLMTMLSGLVLSGCQQQTPTATPAPAEPTVAPTEAAPAPTAPPTPTEEAAPAPTEEPAPAGGGNLRIAVQESANVLNPYLGFNDTETFCIGALYDTLIDYDMETATIKPWLADSWEWDPDRMGATFHLNPDAKWHDGEPVTADDVVFSFNYMQQQQFPSFFAIARNYGGIEKVDDHTVHVKFNYPQVDAIRFVGSVVSIIPEHIWKDIEDGQSFPNTENPIGSGPFRFKEMTPGESIVLEATHEHYRMNPNIDTITLRVVNDETVGVMALKNGEFDALMWDVSPDIAADVQNRPDEYPNVKLSQVGGLRTRTLMFNLRRQPYDNVAFRKALAQAVNVDLIIEDVMLGFADPVGPGLFPPAGAQWYNPDIPMVEYDPGAAQEALDAAGFVDADGDGWRDQPDGSPLNISILCTSDPVSLDTANYIVADFAEVGIQAETDAVDMMGMRPRQKAADFDAAISGVNMSEPGMVVFYLGSDRGEIQDGQVVGFNFGGYANPEFDEAAQASRTAFDVAERQQLLFKLQEILAEDMPQIPLYIPQTLNLYRDDTFTGWVAKPGLGILTYETLENLKAK